MDESSKRMTDKANKPDDESVKNWIGKRQYRYWEEIVRFINNSYPGVFTGNDWIYGGSRHGWCLRFKKSKSFCSLIPEKNNLKILIVFGTEEREKTEKILPGLNPEIQELYNEAATYHDGKWVLIPLNDKILDDLKKLLEIKRKPKTN